MSKQQKYILNSTQVNLPKYYDLKLRDFVNNKIKSTDIRWDDPNGKQTDLGIPNMFHCTVLFGILDNDPEKVKEILIKSELKSIYWKIGELSKFSANGYDVLIHKIYSEDLELLHLMLKQELENDYQFHHYIPHLTLAYLYKGKVDDYIRNLKSPIENETFTSNSIDFVNIYGEKTKLHLE